MRLVGAVLTYRFIDPGLHRSPPARPAVIGDDQPNRNDEPNSDTNPGSGKLVQISARIGAAEFPGRPIANKSANDREHDQHREREPGADVNSTSGLILSAS